MLGDGSISIEGMSTRQLYDLMCQLKHSMEENREQTRQILQSNPMLLRALFQAQIALGMVGAQGSNLQRAMSQTTSKKVAQLSNSQNTQSLPVQSEIPSQLSSSQPLVSAKPQLSIPLPTAANPPLNIQPQSQPSVAQHITQQDKGQASAQVPLIPASQTSLIHNLPLPPAPTHYSTLQTHTSQSQPSLAIPGLFNQAPSPPLPPQPRPPPTQHFAHQSSPQMPHSLSYQPTSGPQPIFHSGNTPPSSFPLGQPPLPSQPPPHQLFQGGPYVGLDYNNQGKAPMQPERGASWAPSLPERAKEGPHFQGPPSLVSAQMTPSPSISQMPNAPPMTPAMERAVFDQVRSLTPEQINHLPPDQRQQVLELQKMLRLS